MTKAIFFDLYYTLIFPKYSDKNEYDVVSISVSEWEKYAEDNILYQERAQGNVKTEQEIIDKIVNIMPYQLNESQKQEILRRRQDRMKRALITVDDIILNTIKKIHDRGIKIGLISNADIIDTKYWSESPLSEFINEVTFSCDVGMLKPNSDIYRVVMHKLQVMPEESIFVGDGGSDELYGAKNVGMKTVFTEYLERKSEGEKEKINQHADYHIDNFVELIRCIDW